MDVCNPSCIINKHTVSALGNIHDVVKMALIIMVNYLTTQMSLSTTPSFTCEYSMVNTTL